MLQIWSVFASLWTNMSMFCMCNSCHRYQVCLQVASQIWRYFVCAICVTNMKCVCMCASLVTNMSMFVCASRVTNLKMLRNSCHKYDVCLKVFSQTWTHCVCTSRVTNMKTLRKSCHKYEVCVQVVSQIQKSWWAPQTWESERESCHKYEVGVQVVSEKQKIFVRASRVTNRDVEDWGRYPKKNCNLS